MQNTNEIAREGEPIGVEFSTPASAPEPVQGADTHPTSDAEELYREHHAFVWRNARRLGCGDDWVDDAVHEIFLVAARKLPTFERRSSVRTWLFAIAQRVIRRMKRDRARYASKVVELSLDDAERRSESPEARSESARYLRRLLERLDESRRAVVILMELEGMTSAEVAEATGTKQGTVESRLRSARLALHAMIERDRLTFERRMR
jgi:RNA polymerase sigma-70 factor, ECF subfamily